MPALQSRDVPEDIYSAYKKRCTQEDRSMSQHTLRLIKMYLAMRDADAPSEVGNNRESDRAAACRMASCAVASAPAHENETLWCNSIYNPMADIIGREERIARRKALFKHIDEQDWASRLPQNLPSAAELIREDRDSDHGHDSLWKEIE